MTTTQRGRRLLRKARGAGRRLRDAGRLLSSGTVPAARQAPAASPAKERRPGELQRVRVVTSDAPRPGPTPAVSTGVDPVYFGWTRYSAHFANDQGLAFKATSRFPDEDAYLRYLWSPERMAARDHIFLELSVPIFQRWADEHDYRHVVTYSPEMPAPWIDRLLRAAELYPVLSLHPPEDGSIVDIMRTTLQTERHPSRPVTWLRVDDDDLLSLDFIDVLDGHVRSHGPGWAVSLSKGLEAIYDDGQISLLRGRHYVLGALGQAVVGDWDGDDQVLEIKGPGNHMTVDTRLPTVLDSRRATFIYLKHTGQDTRTTLPPTVQELRAKHLRNKAVVKEPAKILARFPTLADAYDPTE